MKRHLVLVAHNRSTFMALADVLAFAPGVTVVSPGQALVGLPVWGIQFVDDPTQDMLDSIAWSEAYRIWIDTLRARLGPDDQANIHGILSEFAQ